MAESGKTDFIYKKSYEISYALWRVATNVKEGTLADRLFDKAIELVGCAANGDHAGMAKIADGLQMIIKFAVDVNCIGVSNAVILAREIGNLQAAIEKPAESTTGDDVDISDLFSAKAYEEELPEELPIEETKFENLQEVEESGNFAGIENNSESANESNSKAEIRQSAILQRIRQIGNCRLSDIQAILPDSSERTIRYDLESLVRRNLIERIGIGGRSVYYQPK